VALPELIEELFSALYEAQTGIFSDKAEAQARVEAIKERASKQYGCTKEVLLKTVMTRYRTWIRDNKLSYRNRLQENE
jgi:hypothetical protein